MPSRFEGLPLAMVEAMLCARPVVATDVAGHAEIIEDGVTGFLADAPTAGSMAAALERFWERRSEAEAIGKAGAERIGQLAPRTLFGCSRRSSRSALTRRSAPSFPRSGNNFP